MLFVITGTYTSSWSSAHNDFVFFIYCTFFSNDKKYIIKAEFTMQIHNAEFTRCRVHYLCRCRIHQMTSWLVTLGLWVPLVCYFHGMAVRRILERTLILAGLVSIFRTMAWRSSGKSHVDLIDNLASKLLIVKCCTGLHSRS